MVEKMKDVEKIREQSREIDAGEKKEREEAIQNGMKRRET